VSNFLKNKKHGNAWAGILILLTFILTLGLAVMSDSLSTTLQTRKLAQIHVAQALCDAGVERAIWELNTSRSLSEMNFTLPTGYVEISVVGGAPSLGEVEIETTAYVPDKENAKTTRTVRAKIIDEPNESAIGFDKAVQVGGQGLYVSNNARLNGSVYSGGNVGCQTNGFIDGSIYVHNNNSGPYKDIIGCTKGGVINAFANNISGTVVSGDGGYAGTCSGSSCTTTLRKITIEELGAEVPYVPLPISDTEISRWKNWAARDGLPYEGNFTVSSTGNVTLGPKVINGDLEVNGGTLTLTGAVQVKGNIKIATNSTIKLAATFGPNGGILMGSKRDGVADTGWIEIGSNVTINGSGHSSSYILIISESDRIAPASPAIYAGNNSGSVVYFAGSGMIRVKNGATVNAISGEGLWLEQNAILDFRDGLQLGNFSGGPGRTWRLIEWQVLYPGT
jgi:hypothetical protein